MIWLRRGSRAREDARHAREQLEHAAEQLDQERRTAAAAARLADRLRDQARHNGFSEAMEALYRQHQHGAAT